MVGAARRQPHIHNEKIHRGAQRLPTGESELRGHSSIKSHLSNNKNLKRLEMFNSPLDVNKKKKDRKHTAQK